MIGLILKSLNPKNPNSDKEMADSLINDAEEICRIIGKLQTIMKQL